MSHHRIFVVLAIVSLIVIAGLTVRLAVATTEIVSGSSAEAAGPLEAPPPADQDSSNQSAAQPALDDCFDVSVSELLDCRSASQAAIQGLPDLAAPSRPPVDVCFDVSPSEVCDE